MEHLDEKAFQPLSKKPFQGSVVQVFFNVHMGMGHDGLKEVARKNKILVDQLTPGEYAVFINRLQTRLKVYASNHVIAYYNPGRGKIDLSIIQELPRVFGASHGMNFDQALSEALIRRLLKGKPTREVEELGKKLRDLAG